MSTLEKLQAAAKAKLSAGQLLAATPVSNAPTAAIQTSSQPKVTTAPTTAAVTATKSPAATPTVKAPTSTATVSPQIQQEIQRKAAAGIALTNPTAASTAAYKAAQPATSSQPKVAVQYPSSSTAPKSTTPPTTAVDPNTNYVQKGGQTLNDILYLKGNYNAGNKDYIAKQANPLYGQLDQQTAAMVKGMNYDQLRDYINGLGDQTTATTQNEGMAKEEYVDPYALTLEKIREQVAAEQQAKLDSLNSSYAATAKNIQGRYDYQKGNTRDDRALEDASFNRNNAPTAWDGSTGYQAGITARQRQISDDYTGMALQDNLAAAYAPVSDYANNMGDLANARINELIQQEREYNLNVADRTGNLNGYRTLNGNAQDYSQMADTRNYNYGVSQDRISNDAQYNGTYNGNKTADQQQREWDNRFNYGQAIGQFGNGQQTMENKQFQEGIRQDNRNYERGIVESDREFNLIVKKFEEDVRQFGIQTALEKNAQAISSYNAQTSRQSSNNSSNNADFNKKMDIWKATGEAPDGIDGVAKGTKWYDQVGERQSTSTTNTKYNYKNDPDFNSDISAMVKDPIAAREALRSEAQAYIDKYGIEGYNYMITTINK